MANQTVTTVVNYDDAAISGLNNGESIAINGGSVTIDADVRWNQQEAVFGNVVLSATLGGSFLIDGTQIWEVPFSASSGNVPTQNALGSNGVTGGTSGATGELTRVWATGSLDPATAGGAMPATGFIKLRSKTGTFQSGETITLPGGATVTASGAGKRSWIHVVGRGTTTSTGSRLTIPRLGIFEAEGDWYELGETDGTDDQTFQFPVADACPAIWIETAPASGTYEIWLNSGDRWTNSVIATGDKRGQYFGMDNATGVITIAARTGNTAGLKPASGCKVRVPNIIMSQANGTAPDYNANILPAAIVSRYGFTTTSAGSVIMDKVSCNWTAVTSSAFEIDISDSGIAAPGVNFSNTGTTVTLNNVGIGAVQALSATVLTINASYGGGSLTDVRTVHRLAAANLQGINITDAADFTLTRVRSDFLGVTTTGAQVATALAFIMSRVSNSTLTDCVGIGAIGIALVPAFSVDVTGFKFASRSIGTTQTADTASALSVTSGSTDIYIDGFENFDGIANCHPYANIISSGTGVDGLEIRNIGTPSVPYNMGTANPCGVIYAGSVTRNVTLRRLYADNTRTGLYITANNIQGFQTYNVWGDAADAQAILAVNATVRGGRFTNNVTGQSAVYGTHWQDGFTSTTDGRLIISCNEPTPGTTSQCTFTLDTAAGSGFTSAGSVRMSQLTDVVEWTMPYFMLGVTGFANTAPTITGTNAANHTLEFQYDLNDGNGYNGTWLALSGANLNAITVDPNDGVKLKVKATVNTASTTNLLTYIRIDTVTNATDYEIQYPLPTTQLTAAVTGIETGSRIQVYNVTTSTEVANEIITGTSWSVLYDEGTTFTDGDTVRVRVRKPGFLPYESLALASLSGWAILTDQATDSIYSASSPANYTTDYVNLKIRATGTRASFSAQEVVDIIRDSEATQDGIELSAFANISGLVELSPGVSTAITVDLLGWQLSWASGGVTHANVSGGNVVGGISGDPIEDVVGGPQVTVRVSADSTVVATGSAVLPADITAIAAAVWDSVLASHLTAGSTGEALNVASSGNADISAIKAKTDNLPANPASVSDIPTAVQVADTVLRRSTANIETSGTGDAINLKSLYGMIAQGVHNTQVTGATLTVTKSDDVTVLGTRTVTTDSEAKPIIGIDSD